MNPQGMGGPFFKDEMVYGVASHFIAGGNVQIDNSCL